jgi:hypothetical protein
VWVPGRGSGRPTDVEAWKNPLVYLSSESLLTNLTWKETMRSPTYHNHLCWWVPKNGTGNPCSKNYLCSRLYCWYSLDTSLPIKAETTANKSSKLVTH